MAADMSSDLMASRHRFDFLDYLRAAAAWVVVFDHLFGRWVPARGMNLRAVSWMRTYVGEPLGIIQDFGWMAVATFFLISGFIITHVAGRESVSEFLLKRFLRIVPPLVVFVFLRLLVAPHVWHRLSWTGLFLSLTLLNYFTPLSRPVVGAAWTLAIEMMFYILTATTMLVRRQGVALLAGILVPLAIECSSHSFGDAYFLFAANAAYLPYLVVGQIFYLGIYRKSMSGWTMLIALTACYANLIIGLKTIHTLFLPIDNSYLISFFYACAIFLTLLTSRDRIASTRAVKYLAGISFEVYLVHGVFGPVVLDHLWPVLGPYGAILIVLAGTLIGAALCHRLLSEPLSSLGKMWGRKLRPHVVHREPTSS